MLKMLCDKHAISFDLKEAEDRSILITGISRYGKTFFASLFANWLICRGNYVQLIDLGNKWRREDRKRFVRNVSDYRLFNHDYKLAFASKRDILSSVKTIALALGFKSGNAISAIKTAMNSIMLRNEPITLQNIYIFFQRAVSNPEDLINPYYNHILERLDDEELPDVTLYVASDDTCYTEFYKNCIWDLSETTSEMAKLVSSLIIASNLSLKTAMCSQFPNLKENWFLIIDEFHNLNLNSSDILGKVLTEGMKHNLYTMLITQFLSEKFSPHIQEQLKQSGFKITFRVSDGPDAKAFAKKYSGTPEIARKNLKMITNLPLGECIIDGPLIIDKTKHISGPKLVKVSDDEA